MDNAPNICKIDFTKIFCEINFTNFFCDIDFTKILNSIYFLFSKLPEDEEDDLRPVGVERSQSTVSRGSQGPGWRANMKGDYDLSSVKPIATKDLLCWAYQVRSLFRN